MVRLQPDDDLNNNISLPQRAPGLAASNRRHIIGVGTTFVLLNKLLEAFNVAISVVLLKIVGISIHDVRDEFGVLLLAQGVTSAWRAILLLAISACNQDRAVILVGGHQVFPSRMQGSAVWSPLY